MNRARFVSRKNYRDVTTQAVFTLKRDIVYKNDEMNNLMCALDIEDNLDGLRYEKVILATDADGAGESN